MASGSNAVPRRVGDYDVFISHCGDDCKQHFADLVRVDLENAGVQCFFDEHSLEVGDDAAKKMLKAMEEATYGVVIISPGFFEREWCMKELETFLRRGRIVPVFFGSFTAIQAAADAALAKGAWRSFERFKWTDEEYQGLMEARTLFTGVRLIEKGWWHTCIRRVRNEVLRLLGRLGGGPKLPEDELLVGQEEHLKVLKRLLGLHQEGMPAPSEGRASREVGIVGVKGMGGVGKTTMAKKLYNSADVREWFKGGVCWLEVGPRPSKNEIRDLQKQVLKQLGGVDEDPGNPTLGWDLICQRLNGKRVLICLDDVWETVSIETAIVRSEDLAPGSRILKTSRKKESIGGHVHDLDSLDPEAAWELFCWHAFGGEKPPDGLAELAEKAAARCGGLPLALRVLGRQVAEAEDKKGCVTGFLELPRHDDAMKACRSVVKTSYDNLPTDFAGLGDVFILIAGVWPRKREFMLRQRAVENLGAAVYGAEPRGTRFELARKALDKLNSLSLVGLKKDDDDDDDVDVRELHLSVHDLIVDVAQTLADRKEPGCGKFFRQPADPEGLGLPDDFRGLKHLSTHSGSLSIGEFPAACSLVLGPGAQLGAQLVGSSPSPCKLLDMEEVRSVRLNELANLRCLRLRRGSFDLFPEGIENLRYLCILEATGCKALRSLPESVERLTGLTSLDLSECRALASLPESVGRLTGLTSLDLGRCERLTSLAESVGRLTGLTSLDLSRCRQLESLPESVGQLTGLTSLDLYGCNALLSLPESFKELTGVKILDLSDCLALTFLPEPVMALTGLTSLDLNWRKQVRSLPNSVGDLTGLTRLDLSRCQALKTLPESVGKMTGLTSLDLRWCSALRSLPDSVGDLTGLTRLDLSRCKALKTLPESVEKMTGLTSLDLRWCSALESLPETMETLAGLLQQLTPLRTLTLHSLFGLDHQGALQCLPEWVGKLTGLTSLDLRWCSALESLPHSVGDLTGLTKLDLSSCKALRGLPESVGALTGLTSLDLYGCKTLASLPGSVGRLTRLTSLDLSWCRALQGASRYWWAAAKGEAWAQWHLGACYYHGIGVGKDEARAAELYAKAAEQGDARGQCDLGVCYERGRGVEKDEARAAELYAKAAEQGHATAQCYLGLCYANGTGVEKDGARAVKWMRTAAEQGDPAIEANLAEVLMEGLGGAPNWVEALRLFESSLNIYAPSKVTSAWMLWVGQNDVQQDRLRARTMCEEVSTTEDLEDQLRGWEAVGWTWPAALEWFRSEAWRADEPSGEVVERGEGESEAEARTEPLKQGRRMD